MIRRHFFTLALLSTLCGGCVPYKLQISPELHGRVIDAATATPIAHASLHFEIDASHFYFSGPDGTYAFPAEKRWQIVPLAPYDPIGIWLVAEADGYQQSRKMFNPRRAPSTWDIELERR